MHGNRRILKLIGITGQAGSGKDTVAQALVEIGFAQYMFALPLKVALCAMFGWTPEQVAGATPEWREWREKQLPGFDFSPRRAMQTLGTEWGRALDPDIWVKLADEALRALDAAEKPPIGLVVSDVRFENEAKWIRESGGEVWHIERQGVAGVASHQSENGVRSDPHDVVLFNSGTREGLQRAAQIIARGE